MNKILIGLLVIVVGFVVYGKFMSNEEDGGAKWIGIGIFDVNIRCDALIFILTV